MIQALDAHAQHEAILRSVGLMLPEPRKLLSTRCEIWAE
jgi:hypothetical protein